MRKKELRVRISYESNRLAENYLSDAYKKLIPVIKHPIDSNKKNEMKKEKLFNNEEEI